MSGPSIRHPGAPAASLGVGGSCPVGRLWVAAPDVQSARTKKQTLTVAAILLEDTMLSPKVPGKPNPQLADRDISRVTVRWTQCNAVLKALQFAGESRDRRHLSLNRRDCGDGE